MIHNIIMVALGGALGSVGRYLFSKAMQDNVATAFPIGTMAVNILGCFLIGLFYAMLEKMHIMNPDLQLFLTVGFCGGFTTFSTFMNESMSLFRADNLLMGALYIGGSVALGMIAVVAGAKIMTF